MYAASRSTRRQGPFFSQSGRAGRGCPRAVASYHTLSSVSPFLCHGRYDAAHNSAANADEDEATRVSRSAWRFAARLVTTSITNQADAVLHERGPLADGRVAALRAILERRMKMIAQRHDLDSNRSLGNIQFPTGRFTRVRLNTPIGGQPRNQPPEMACTIGVWVFVQSSPANDHFFALMHHRCPVVRRKSCPYDTAGEA